MSSSVEELAELMTMYKARCIQLTQELEKMKKEQEEKDAQGTPQTNKAK